MIRQLEFSKLCLASLNQLYSFSKSVPTVDKYHIRHIIASVDVFLLALSLSLSLAYVWRELDATLGLKIVTPVEE